MGRRANIIEAARTCVNVLPSCKRKDLYRMYDIHFDLCMLMTVNVKIKRILHEILNNVEAGHTSKALLLRYYKLNHIQGVCIKKFRKKAFINCDNLAITDTLSQVSMKICGMITSLQSI